jgi:hypothetical protein
MDYPCSAVRLMAYRSLSYILRPGVCRLEMQKARHRGVMNRCLTVRCPEKEAGFAVFRA